jgi:hypothetical protein
MRYDHAIGDTPERKIERLEHELEHTRQIVISLAPYQFGRLLYGVEHKFKTESDLWSWHRDVVHTVSRAAKRDQHGRSPCPLCGSHGNSQDWGNDGWLVPGGLQMHLRGESKAEKCVVLDVALKLLRAEHRETIAATEQAEADALVQRKKTEPLLCIDPHREPVLMAEPSDSYRERRPPDAWPPIEARLRNIGFAIEKTGNVTSYRYIADDKWIALADPRDADRVTFAIFRSGGKYRWIYKGSFALQDRWRDWLKNFRLRLLKHAPDVAETIAERELVQAREAHERNRAKIERADRSERKQETAEEERARWRRARKVGMFDALDAQRTPRPKHES